MRIILLEPVNGRGAKNQIVEVADGYGNFLVRQKKAAIANNENLLILDRQLIKAQEEHLAQIDKAITLKNDLETTTLVFNEKLTPRGTLVHKITSKEIAKLVNSTFNTTIDKHKIELKYDLETAGVHYVNVKLYNNIVAKLRINIIPI